MEWVCLGIVLVFFAMGLGMVRLFERLY